MKNKRLSNQEFQDIKKSFLSYLAKMTSDLLTENNVTLQVANKCDGSEIINNAKIICNLHKSLKLKIKEFSYYHSYKNYIVTLLDEYVEELNLIYVGANLSSAEIMTAEKILKRINKDSDIIINKISSNIEAFDFEKAIYDIKKTKFYIAQELRKHE